MTQERKLLKKYADTAADLAESVKADIQHDGVITDKTVLALNDFIIASNAVATLLGTLNEKQSLKH